MDVSQLHNQLFTAVKCRVLCTLAIYTLSLCMPLHVLSYTTGLATFAAAHISLSSRKQMYPVDSIRAPT